MHCPSRNTVNWKRQLKLGQPQAPGQASLITIIIIMITTPHNQSTIIHRSFWWQAKNTRCRQSLKVQKTPLYWHPLCIRSKLTKILSYRDTPNNPSKYRSLSSQSRRPQQNKGSDQRPAHRLQFFQSKWLLVRKF